MATLEAVTDATFEERVLRAVEPVLVDFWAEWCPPCHAITPGLEQLAQELAGRLTILALDVDQNPHATARYGVRGMPTLILYRDGQPVTQVVGARPKAALLRALAPYLKEAAVAG